MAVLTSIPSCTEYQRKISINGQHTILYTLSIFFSALLFECNVTNNVHLDIVCMCKISLNLMLRLSCIKVFEAWRTLFLLILHIFTFIKLLIANTHLFSWHLWYSIYIHQLPKNFNVHICIKHKYLKHLCSNRRPRFSFHVELEIHIFLFYH